MMLKGDILHRWQNVGVLNSLVSDSEIADFLLKVYEEHINPKICADNSSICTICLQPLTPVCLTCNVATASVATKTRHLSEFSADDDEQAHISNISPAPFTRENSDQDSYVDYITRTKQRMVELKQQHGQKKNLGTPHSKRKTRQPNRHLKGKATIQGVESCLKACAVELSQGEGGQDYRTTTGDNDLIGLETNNATTDVIDTVIKIEASEPLEHGTEESLDDVVGETVRIDPLDTVTTVKRGRPKGRKTNKSGLQPLVVDDEDDSRPFQCPLCFKHFRARNYCMEHIKSHDTSNLAYSCQFCSARFHTSGLLRRHLRKHTGKKPVSCETCGKMLSSTEALISHSRIHTGEQPYQCDQCGAKFRQTSNLSTHRRIAHCTERPFACLACPAAFVAKSSLNAHMQTHTDHRPYLCEDCGSAFKTKGNLKLHVLTHSNSRNVPCPLCEQKFYTNTQLRKHLRSAVHYNVRDIICNTCGARFNRQSSLKKHMMGHTGIRPAKCEECGKGFRTTNLLKVHQRIHTGERPVLCDVCGLGFQTRGNMKKHRNNIHKDAPPLPQYMPPRRNELPRLLETLDQPMEVNANDSPPATGSSTVPIHSPQDSLIIKHKAEIQ